jgi:hypothetical protein
MSELNKKPQTNNPLSQPNAAHSAKVCLTKQDAFFLVAEN